MSAGANRDPREGMAGAAPGGAESPWPGVCVRGSVEMKGPGPESERHRAGGLGEL